MYIFIQVYLYICMCIYRYVYLYINLSKKMECYASCPAFITIKDHKPNFEIRPNVDYLIL